MKFIRKQASSVIVDNVNLGDLEISRSAFLGKTTHGLLGGYRAMYQDYTDGSGDNKFEWNVTLHGPILGLGMVFVSILRGMD